METNRTLEILRTYNYAQKNHWQLMCDLANNDYDIDYFSGRVSINDDFDIHKILDWLRDTVRECYDDQKSKNQVNYQGAIDECNLLLNIANHDYLIFINS